MAKMMPIDTWPELRVTIVPLPWCWRLIPRFYRDDVDGGFWGHSSFEWLCLRLEWWNNRPMFVARVERFAQVLDSGGYSLLTHHIGPSSDSPISTPQGQ